jgi:alanyl-tRNA synthetase
MNWKDEVTTEAIKTYIDALLKNTNLNEFEKLTKNKKELSGKETFLLFQSYGFPIEMTKELCTEKQIKKKVTIILLIHLILQISF